MGVKRHRSPTGGPTSSTDLRALPPPGSGLSSARGKRCLPSGYQLVCTCITLVLLVNLLLALVFGLHYYDAEYTVCRQQKKTALAITASELCTDADLRDIAKTYGQVDCLVAEEQLRVHPRTCATLALAHRAYSHVNDNLVQQIRGSLSDVWGTVTSTVALLLVYPITGVVAYVLIANAKEKTRRRGLEIQSEDRRARYQNEVMERSLVLLQDARQMQGRLPSSGPGRRHSRGRGPVIEEAYSDSEQEEEGYEGYEELEGIDEGSLSDSDYGTSGNERAVRNMQSGRDDGGAAASRYRTRPLSKVPSRGDM